MATYYWVGGSGTWDNSSKTNWATSTGGAGGFGPPTSADDVVFDTNSGASATVTVAGTAVCAQCFMTQPGINLSLSGSPTFSSQLTLTNGTLTLNSYTLTVLNVASNNSNVRSIDFGTGNITITKNGGSVWNFATTTNFTLAGTPVLNFTYSGGTGTRTYTHVGTASNSPSVNVTAGTDTFTLSGTCINVDFTGFAGTLSNIGTTVYGNYKLSTGMTLTAGANATTFAATSGTKTVTSNGRAIDFPVFFDGVGGTWQLQDAMTVGTTRIVTLTNGALDLSLGSLTCGSFSSNNSNVRSVAFGTNKIICTGNSATVFGVATITNFSCTGSRRVDLTYNGSTGTRTVYVGAIAGTATQDNTPDIYVTAGSDIVRLFTNNTTTAVRTLDTTGFSGSIETSAFRLFGNLVLSATTTISATTNAISFVSTQAGNTITTNGATIDRNVTFDGVGGAWALQDNMTLGSTRTVTLTNGALSLAGNGGNWTLTTGLFSSTNSNTRSIAFGTGKIVLTYNNFTIFNMSTVTGFSCSGSRRVDLAYAGATGTRNIFFANDAAQVADVNNTLDFYVTAGSDTVSIVLNSQGGSVRTLDTTGFSGTLGTPAFRVYGNLNLSSTTTVAATTGIISFLSTATGNTITTNGVTIDRPVTFNGIGGEWSCNDALTLGSTRALTLTNGTLKLKAGTTSTVGSFVTSGTTMKYLSSTTPGTQATISDSSGTNSVSYLSIQDSVATGGATWQAYLTNNNADAGNNLGWDFALQLGKYMYSRRKNKRILP